jgi:hypothetical protein
MIGKKIELSEELISKLGKVSDHEVALMAGCSEVTIRRRRLDLGFRRHKIRNYKKLSQEIINRLGEDFDTVLAKEADCCIEKIISHRKKLKIPAYCKSGNGMKRSIDLFWAKVNKDTESGCWEWTGRINAGGYGVFCSRNFKSQLAHRTSWEINNGPITSGKLVCHVCDNARCIRIDHLFLGTQKDNVQDCIKKGRYTYNTNRIDLDQSVIDKMGKIPDTRLAKIAGVAINTISSKRKRLSIGPYQKWK